MISYIKDVFITLEKLKDFVRQNYLHHYYEPDQLCTQIYSIKNYNIKSLHIVAFFVCDEFRCPILHINSTVSLHTVQQEICILAAPVTWFCDTCVAIAHKEKYRYE